MNLLNRLLNTLENVVLKLFRGRWLKLFGLFTLLLKVVRLKWLQVVWCRGLPRYLHVLPILPNEVLERP